MQVGLTMENDWLAVRIIVRVSLAKPPFNRLLSMQAMSIDYGHVYSNQQDRTGFQVPQFQGIDVVVHAMFNAFVRHLH